MSETGLRRRWLRALLGSWLVATLLGTAVALAALISGAAASDVGSNEVNVYSLRQSFLVKPLFDAFTKETGIKVNVVFAKKGLVQRLKSEGANSPADLLFTAEVGRLQDAYDAGVTQAVSSSVLRAAIPTTYRHPEGHWYGMTTRVRILYVSKERVKPGEIGRYEDLATPKWRGRICTRSGKNSYNLALIASMIAHHGKVEAAE